MPFPLHWAIHFDLAPDFPIFPDPIVPIFPEAADLPIRSLYKTRSPVSGWKNGGNQKYPQMSETLGTGCVLSENKGTCSLCGGGEGGTRRLRRRVLCPVLLRAALQWHSVSKPTRIAALLKPLNGSTSATILLSRTPAAADPTESDTGRG